MVTDNGLPLDGRAEITRIIAERAITPLFQPIVDLETGETVACELLSRGPRDSPLFSAPALFHAALQAGVVSELDRLCIIVGIQEVLQSGINPGLLFVNIESSVTRSTGYQQELVDLIDTAPFGVVAEFTERAMTRTLAHLIDHADVVRRRGNLIALDDLGADPASLALVPLLRPDILKLDLAVTQGTSPEAAATAAAVWEHARNSDAIILAEGVETEAHRERAIRLGARWGQGWLFGRPGPIGAFGERELAGPTSAARLWTGASWASDDTHPTADGESVSRLMLAQLSRQIEDQARRWGQHAVLLTAVESADRLTTDLLARYSAIADRASLVGIVAPGVSASPAPGVQGGSVGADDALADHWAVAVVGPHFSAALTAIADPAREGWYRAVWSQDPSYAARVARALARRLAEQKPPEPMRFAGVTVGGARLSDLSSLVNRPEVRVAALSAEGLIVEMPAALGSLGGRSVEGRTPLDWVEPAMQGLVVSAWTRAVDGVPTWLAIRTSEGLPAFLAFHDVRDDHGVFLGLLIPDATAEGSLERAVTVEHEGIREISRSGWMNKGPGAVILDADEDVCALLGYAAEDLVGLRALELIHPEDRERSIQSWVDMLSRPGVSRRVRLRHRRGDGRYLWCEITNHNALADPAKGCVLSELVDVDAEVTAQLAVATQQRTLRTLAESLSTAVVVIDANFTLAYANQRVAEAVPWLTVNSGGDLLNLLDRDDRRAVVVSHRLAVETLQPQRITVGLTDRHSGVKRVYQLDFNASGDGGAVICGSEITAEVALHEQLKRQATRDALTGCWNRAAILEQICVSVAAPGRGVAVFYVDLDGFKGVNDRLGHAAGDAVLVRTSTRLGELIRPEDVLGRFGGDEFLVLSCDVPDEVSAQRLAAQLRCRLGSDPTMSATVGVSWTGDPVGADALIAAADSDMYRRKPSRSVA